MFQNIDRPINIILRGKAATSLLPSTCCAPFVTVVHSINFSTLSPRSLIPDVVLKENLKGFGTRRDSMFSGFRMGPASDADWVIWISHSPRPLAPYETPKSWNLS